MTPKKSAAGTSQKAKSARSKPPEILPRTSTGRATRSAPDQHVEQVSDPHSDPTPATLASTPRIGLGRRLLRMIFSKWFFVFVVGALLGGAALQYIPPVWRAASDYTGTTLNQWRQQGAALVQKISTFSETSSDPSAKIALEDSSQAASADMPDVPGAVAAPASLETQMAGAPPTSPQQPAPLPGSATLVDVYLTGTAPLAPVWADLEAALPATLLQGLTDQQFDAVPTRGDLMAQIYRGSSERAAGPDPSAEQDRKNQQEDGAKNWGARLFSSLIRVRPLDAMRARFETQVAQGDLAAALATFENLSAPDRAALGQWAIAARARHLRDQALLRWRALHQGAHP